uniref:Uncharacterized protein n=1 Tax=Moniliophthora roreri TaxID=221103 RepID=A0A0W0FLV4_MONRR
MSLELLGQSVRDSRLQYWKI